MSEAPTRESPAGVGEPLLVPPPWLTPTVAAASGSEAIDPSEAPAAVGQKSYRVRLPSKISANLCRNAGSIRPRSEELPFTVYVYPARSVQTFAESRPASRSSEALPNAKTTSAQTVVLCKQAARSFPPFRGCVCVCYRATLVCDLR